ncbi:hypothetical protein CQ12_06750 [Bradyrhizobium jicamae]|uniref:Heme peroxidase n=1 Tax=Bradyrhizobium jicamae TaxID=280332 RepID=A0A0R3L4H3_9BRAD|nr:peroxidase family protein [Bradyrhizobium jicamae]KRR02770.1 hypothetical protein CQ12_06750 [Bradyrhizobium jicamae]
MVVYIKSDLEFILAQIKIAEAHAAGQPLFGTNGLVPAYNLSLGLRTVDGTYNHLIAGQERWGAGDSQFPSLLNPAYRPADGTLFDPDGPMGPAPAMPTALNYNPSNNPNSLVFDSSLRTISNLLVDQTLGNPAAILTALERAGSENPMADLPQVTAIYQVFKPAWDAEYQARVVMQNAKAAAEELGDGDPLTPPSAEEQAAIDAWTAATADHAATVTALDEARAVRNTALEPFGIAMDGDNVHLPNVAPDEGLSAPFNSWFTLFGQFFDHGLDLVNKGGSGTVFIPLQPDDPLYVQGSHTNFMVLTRATVSAGPDGVMNTSDDVRPVNTTTSYVDQNQTYTSHPSHQVFLRQYVLNAAGDPVATGKLIEGENGGMATWAEVKEQARTVLGINLTDNDVGSVPLLRTDAYGNFIPGDNGFPQLIIGIGPDGIPNTIDDIVREGDPNANPDSFGVPQGVFTTGAIRTSHAFLADIAHEAVPVGKIADGDITIGLGNPGNGDTEYDNELLDAHFIAGDGRVNENIGLTAVHHVFHAEHNRLVEHTKEQVLATNDLAFINEWLVDDLLALPTPAQVTNLVWDGERLFQAAKFGTEMQYQHLVFEEFARKIQPNINVFVVPDGFDSTINPSIVAEFAHVVYRFGHSMLTESIDRFSPAFAESHIGLIEGFLNPIQFDNNHAITDDIAAGAIIRGMTRQVGNEIDEFVTTALRNNLLGLPLDLATINLARGRDTGVPSLNAARREFYDATNQDVLLKPYESWADFAAHLKHEASIINFVAAYGTHSLITGADTLEEKRDAALTLITGTAFGSFVLPTDPVELAAFHADRLAFLNATGAYAGGSLGGLENVDLWIGGLAEEIMPFGGSLGSTFNFVFEVQMEKLQNGDRFYYLQRLDGLHLFGEMENNSFAAMIMRNTDATHLPSDVFSTPNLILEVDPTKQFNDLDGDGTLESTDPTGTSLITPLVLRDNPATAGPEANYLRYTGADHVLLGGTAQADTLIASIGDDTLFGDGGNDRLEGGFGNDIINGGAGDDIIKDSGGDDNIKAGDGNDVVHAGPGLDLVMGGKGQDFIFLGTDMGSEVFAGEGNDFIYGHKNAERILGNEGDDWIETGTFDGAPGDNFDEIYAQDGIDGHDVFLGDGGFDEFIAEGGDDIMVGSLGRGKMVGMSGFDWVTYKDNTFAADADFTRGIVFDENPQPPQFGTQDAYEAVEGLSGSSFNDTLTGSDVTAEERLPFAQGGTEGYRGSFLTKEGIARIQGLREVLGLTLAQFDALAANANVYSAGEIILGGDGSDTIMGRGGDDIIDGDKWLNVEIAIHAGVDPVTGLPTGGILERVNSMTELAARMFNGDINPGQLEIVRTIETANGTGDIDTAKYQGNRAEYVFAGNADGTIQVTHAIEDSLDGSDKLRNMERVEFLDGSLNIIVGTPNNDTLNGTPQDDLILGFAGADTLNGNNGNDILVGGLGSQQATYADNFDNNSFGNSTGTAAWDPDWVEANDSGGVTTGQIRIDDGNNTLRIVGGATSDGATITRAVNLVGATAATITFSANPDGLDAGESVLAEFTSDGTTWVNIATITGDGASQNYTFDATGPFPAAAIRFVASAINNTAEVVNIDNLVINFTSPTLNAGVDTLNGGAGDDTYVFAIGDGADVINETSGNDRISISGALTDLNFNEITTGGGNDDLVISLNGGATDRITVTDHFDTAGEAVEAVNFNGATVYGYLLEGDYALSTDDSNPRTANTPLVNTVLVGTTGEDTLTGNTGNDLLFGHDDDDALDGGDGDDLLVGGAGNDELDGNVGLDTLVGGAGSDVYIMTDVEDIIVEALNAGTDQVETDLAAFSLELIDNVENLEYTGVDADPFVGTGNALNNTISGGDLDDTLSGLAGNDTLNGGLGADSLLGGDGNDTLNGGDDNDTLNGGIGNDQLEGGAGADAMTGGDGNDVYDVDDAGDTVTETNADLATGGTDRVESSITYALGANIENLTLTGGDAINGTGNALGNTIIGNNNGNQLFGGAGIDTISGNGGNDLLDGGSGVDTLNGGDGNDTVIGGEGDDIIDVGGGFNTIVYNSTNFGNDTINSFDFDGGAATNQDKIDLSALGITAANLNTRVAESTIGGATNTLLTISDAAGNAIGTIRINNVTNAQIDVNDFTLATGPAIVINGAETGQTTNGTAAAELINANGGNDTVNAAGGNDVVNGGEGTDILNGGDGNDTLSGGIGANTGNFRDEFGSTSYTNNNGSVAFTGGWTETNDGTSSPTAGDIDITGGRLRFEQGTDGGESIQRSFSLAGATAAQLTFTYEPDDLDAGETVVVEAFNGTTWVNLGTLGGDSNGASLNFSANLTAAHSQIRFTAVGNFEDNENLYIDNVNISVTAPGLNAGVDTINGDAGDDTIIWSANSLAPTDGRDVVNGGTEGGAGDTFVINGNASGEAFRIYTRAEFLAVNAGAALNAATEIVVTRNGTTVGSIIAELSEIEEIRINGIDPSGASGGAGAGDTFQIIGDFSGTSLRPNTITIDGDAGNDTVDISSLGSAHRIVFRSNGGNDTIIGTLRPQDVIELPDGATAADYTTTTDANGVSTMTNGTHSVTFTAPDGLPQVGDDDEEDEDDDTGHDDDNDDCGGDDDDDATTGGPMPPASAVGVVRMGTPSADVLTGTVGPDNIVAFAGDDVVTGEDGADAISAGEGADFVSGGDGRDVIFAGAGDDQVFGGGHADIIYGDAGADRIFGDAGNDLINAGAGDDSVFGGAGDDLIVAEVGDGNDVYFGDDSDGGAGVDTLDMSAASANVTVNLGTGPLSNGAASSSQTGNDTIWGIENVNTGSGNDTITASSAVNVMNGGAGNDTYKFTSASAADGDTILTFEAGDRVDLTAIDANVGSTGDQSFSLVSGAFTAAGQLSVTLETRVDGDFTVVQGNIDGDADAEFTVEIAGHHNLTNANLGL